MKLFTWLRRWSITVVPADDIPVRQWPVQEKITPAQADDLRAAAAMRRTLAAAKYREARAITSGEPVPEPGLRVVRKS